MKQQDITTGFQKVDNSQTDFLINFLADVSQFPSVKECFKEQLSWLEIKEGHRILDVGCGIGDQAYEMAKRTGSSGEVIGTDLSETMIQASRLRHSASGLPLVFKTADITDQPFPNETFDRIRLERVLMYVHNVEEAFKEFFRLLRSGGRLLIFDFDWDALTIGHFNKVLTRRIVEFISDSFPNGRIGAELLSYFRKFGFKDIKIKAIGEITPFEFAKRVYGGIIEKGIDNGVFNQTEINEWWIYLDKENQKQSFLTSFNGFIVMGTK